MTTDANRWTEAIQDTEERLRKIERERTRLKMAIRLMKQQVKDGARWPGSSAEASEA